MDLQEVQKYVILKGYTGSLSYGTDTNESDIDIRGVYIPPKQYWLGLEGTDHVDGKSNGTDLFFHALQKFISLALNNNPNILELLYLRKNHYLWKNVPQALRPLGEKLIKGRDLFLSKKCKHTYLGYAYSQFDRMDRLNKNVNQNKKRLEIVEKFGYDTKNAMHMVRLLRSGMEILIEHTLHVFREDARELLAIRNGKYTYEELKKEFDKYRDLYEEAYVKSTLQYGPDFSAINQLCVELAEEAFEIFQEKA